MLRRYPERMNLRLGCIVTVVAIVVCGAGSARAELRDPTPAEKAVLDKVIDAIGKTLDGIDNDDWEKSQDFYDGNPQVNDHPAVPLDINQNFQRDYRVRVGSRREQEVLKPLEEQLMSASSVEAKVAIGRKLRPLTTLTAYAYINMGTVDVKQAPNPGLTVAGAAFVYAVEPSEAFCQSGASCYLLGFGNWQAARRKPGEQALRFPFAHKPGTPFVENVVIRLTGADDRIRELLRTVDWNALNDALTR